MNAFDKVIGYKATKRELLQLCDMPVSYTHLTLPTKLEV